MKKILFWIAGLFAAALLGVYLWLLDEAPDPRAQAWLDATEARRQPVGDPYLFLLGIDALPGTSPIERGRARLEAYHQGKPGIEKPGEVLLLQDDQTALCASGTPACLETLLAEPQRGAQLLDSNAVLLERYRQWRDSPAPRQAARPGVEQPIPPYPMLSHGQKLLALEALALSRENPQAAQEILLDDVRALRRHLADADTFIGKMMVGSLLGEDLQRLALWHRRGLLPPLPTVDPLSEAERSLLMPMQHEYAAMAGMFLNLPEEVRREQGNTSLRVFYKPQRTANLAWRHYAGMAELSRLSAAALPAELERPAARPESPWLAPRNAIGQILLSVSGPDYRRYLIRLNDLDARIRLVNLLGDMPADASQWTPGVPASELQTNPYWPDRPARWDAASGQLCHDGPLPDERNLRCLILD